MQYNGKSRRFSCQGFMTSITSITISVKGVGNK